MANTNKKPHPSMGGKPNAKGGSRPLDHPSCGSTPGGVDNTRLGMTGATSHAGGKAHPSLASGIPRSKNPAPISHAIPGGKKTKASGW